MSFLRRRSVPASVKAVVLGPTDRRGGWALTAGREPVVASVQALHLPGRDPIAWHLIAKATWRRPVITVTEIAAVDGDGTVTTVELSEDGDLPEVVNARVSASIAWTNHVRLGPHTGVRIVGRRRAGLDALEWQHVLDKGTDPADAGVRAQVDQLLADAQRSIG